MTKEVVLALIVFLISIGAGNATILEDFLKIRDARESEIKALWKRHREHPELSFLVLERWAEIAPEKLLKENPGYRESETSWLLLGRQNGKRVLDLLNKSPEQDEATIRYVLHGYGETHPEEVIALVKEKEIFMQDSFIRAGIIRGLSGKSPLEAIRFIREHSPVLRREYESDEDKAVHSAIIRWLSFEPEHALKTLVENENPMPTPQFVAILALTIPKQVALASSKLPTGLKKKIFEEGLQMAEENDENLPRVTEMASPREIATTHTFDNLIKKATETPPESFIKWMTDNQLEHLEASKVDLLRAITRERWAAADPGALIRFKITQYDWDFVNELTIWLEEDRKSAIQYIESLGEPDSYSRHRGRLRLIAAIGKKNVREALLRYQRYADENKLNEENELGDEDYGECFLEMAGMDRDAFLEFAVKQDANKQQLMTILGLAWLPKDPNWTIETLTSFDINPFQPEPEPEPDPLSINAEWNPALFEAFSLIPESWRKILINSREIHRGAEIQWLKTKAHPDLSDEELKSIQRSIADPGYWTTRDHTEDLQSIIAEATWLSDHIKGELADWVVIRNSLDCENLKPWIDQLPPEIRKKPLESYQYFYEEKVKRREEAAKKDLDAPVIKYSEELLTKILDSYDPARALPMNSWTESEVENFHSQIKDLSHKQASIFVRKVDLITLPWRIRASLIPKCYENEGLNRDSVLFQSTRDTAKTFATFDPAKAAAWANSIPTERPRILAYGHVLEMWTRYDKDEALDWIATLPMPVQERLGY